MVGVVIMLQLLEEDAPDNQDVIEIDLDDEKGTTLPNKASEVFHIMMI